MFRCHGSHQQLSLHHLECLHLLYRRWSPLLDHPLKHRCPPYLLWWLRSIQRQSRVQGQLQSSLRSSSTFRTMRGMSDSDTALLTLKLQHGLIKGISFTHKLSSITIGMHNPWARSGPRMCCIQPLNLFELLKILEFITVRNSSDGNNIKPQMIKSLVK